MSLLIRGVLHEGNPVDVYIRGNRFERIGRDLPVEAETTLDGSGMAIFPSFVNAHTHAAMTLLRGYADDMELHRWLTEYIWPLEAKLTEEDVRCGTRLAALEMIRSGTGFFSDMYWHWQGTARAVEEMGLRAAISPVFIDFGDSAKAREQKERCVRLFEERRRYSNRIHFSLGPHAVYTVSESSLRWCAEFAEEHDLLIQLHVSETKKEVQDSLEAFGKRPVQYLDSIGLLSPRLIACHAVWLDDSEIELLARHSVRVAHNPVSNMKLCSGNLPYARLRAAGVPVILGTDGCSSNNNLDMFEEMKFAAVNAKSASGDPSLFPAEEAFAAATIEGARAFRLDAGEIAEGKLADCILVDLDHPQMVPAHHLISNLVYSANGSVVDTMICDGRILMRNRIVPGQEEIIAEARATVARLVGKR